MEKNQFEEEKEKKRIITIFERRVKDESFLKQKQRSEREIHKTNFKIFTKHQRVKQIFRRDEMILSIVLF